MRTNREKYEHYCAEIAVKDAAAIAELLTHGVPAQLYEILHYEAIPVEVTSVGVYRRGIYVHDKDDRVTKDEVAIAMKYAEEWESPALDEILVYYKKTDTYGTVTGAHRYSKIESAVDIAWRADALMPEIERRRELYAPREGCKPCNYCRKQHPENELISATIFYRERGGSRTNVGQYCSKTCASNDQCGHEG